jgi:two-component system sensor histidine kinase QseC
VSAGRSLRARLTLAVAGTLAVVLAAFSLAMNAVVERAMRRQLDEQLGGEAAAVAGMAEEDAIAPAEFEYESLPEFERPVRPAYFQAWLDGGGVLARSPSLGQHDLPRMPGGAPAFSDLTLPDGRAGRAIQIRQPLRVEPEMNAPLADGGARPPKGFVTVVVARGTDELREALARVRRWLWGLGLVGVAVAFTAARAAVGRGLRPADRLAAEIARLDEARLDRPLGAAGLPRELEPVARKLNDLLARLRDSFARERRFTADVSHELRTPLAALRTTLEVAGSRERAAPDYRAAIAEAGAVVRQMDGLVGNLLVLARLDAGQVEVRRAPLPLRAFVDDCWRPHEAGARARGLSFANEIPDGAVVDTDADKLRLVAGNLLANAAEYTAAGGAIVARGGSDGVVLEVSDSGPPIPDDLLPRVFDRFTRADAARSGGLHCGIGLALVRSVCDVLGLDATASNEPDGGVTFRIARG